jgi:long-chain acyl-CoA synthetase
MTWDDQHIKRILLDLALKVTDTPFYGSGTYYSKTNSNWKDDIGLDSIALMHLSVAASSFFNLLEMDEPPYLLSYGSVDEWVTYISIAKQSVNDKINFTSSGTTGSSKIITHQVSFLDREINFLATLFNDATHIIPYIPSYTVYGFLLTIGLQQKLNIPIIYPSDIQWHQLPPKALIVATPFHWQLIITAFPLMLNCYGVSSGAPLNNNHYQSITKKGVMLTELYGSTETAGVAFRKRSQQPFTLFPYWKFTLRQDEEIVDVDTMRTHSLMDHVEITGTAAFNVVGRKDKKIKIAGKLADLEHIQTIIAQLPNIQQCSISAKRIDNEPTISAELILVADNEDSRSAIKNQLKQVLKPHETPRVIDFLTNEI